MKSIKYEDIKDGDFLLMYYGWGKMKGKMICFSIFRKDGYGKSHDAFQEFTEYNRGLRFLFWNNEGCLYATDEVKASYLQFFRLTEEEFMLESQAI